MHRTFHTPETIELHVQLGSGELATSAVGTTETSVEVTGPRAQEFAVEQRGRAISVVAPKGGFGSLWGSGERHVVTVVLPTGSDLSTKVGSADVRASGSYGTVSLITGSGDVELEHAEGDVLVRSGSGDVRSHEVLGALRLKSGSGDVDLADVHGEIGISTGSGDIVIGRARSAATVKSGSGDTEIAVADGDVVLGTASGRLTVGSVRSGRVSANNASGDIRIGVPPGVPVWTDISSVTGRVFSTLASVGEPTQGQDHLEVRATTVSGDVHLQQAADTHHRSNGDPS